MRRSKVTLVMLAALVATSCGRLRQAGDLPPEESLYLPSPEDAPGGSTQRQSLCASQSQAYQQLKTWIDEHNEAIQGQIALLKLMVKAASRQLEREGEFEYSAEKEGRSLTLRATVGDDDAVSYTCTYSGPNVEDYRFLEGETAADRNSGTWQFHKPDGTAVVAVDWTRDGDDVHVERQRLDRERKVVYDRSGTTASVHFSGPNYAASATWDTETRDGSFAVGDETMVCWEHQDSDYCTADCPQ